MTQESLAEYARKRDFAVTPEPGSGGGATDAGPLTFVVHRHDASRLHFDLRIECDGVLLSWAIPRGPSDRIGDRRLAVRTEDHPIAYGSFEGVIPEKQYGAGTSIVWDAGTYAPDEPRLLFDDRAGAEAAVRDGLQRGKLSLTFRGLRLKGSWALVQTKSGWLLLKHRDGAAGRIDLPAVLASAYSGRTNDDLASGVAWSPLAVPAHFSPPALSGSRSAAISPLLPMLARSGLDIPASNWIYEPKLDGARVLAYVDQGTARLVSRGGIDNSATYPSIARALAQQPVHSLVLDGEVIAVDASGRPSFELLQRRINLRDPAEIAAAEAAISTHYVAFDILHLDGWDLARVPHWQRRELLARVLLPGARIEAIASIPLPPDDAFRTAVESGFEGIVAKRRDAPYEPGRRSDAWRKRKAGARGVFTVAGWTPGEGSRGATFGALILGERLPGGELDYRGRVGSGFTDADLRALTPRLREDATPARPFARATPEGRSANWIAPGFEVEVAYADRTSGGMLRAPVFLGLHHRTDGEATDSAPGAALAAQLAGLHARGTLSGPGWSLPVTNLDKVLWPATGDTAAVTKRALLAYAIDAWPRVACHLRDRLLTLSRYPNGIDGSRFYQRHWDGVRPAFVETVTVYSDTDGTDKEFLLCNNLPTLLWLCQLADIEWHVGLATVAPRPGDDHPANFAGSVAAVESSPLNYPDTLLFDFDPYIYRGDEKAGDEPQPNEAGFSAAREAAVALRQLLAELGLPGFVKTSGATGLHVFVPIQRTLPFAEVRALAVTMAGELVRRHPRLLTTDWATPRRAGKVFVDANQNARHKALAAAYSPRAKPGAPLSMPVSWDSLPSLRIGAHRLGSPVVPAGDPWATLREAAVDLRVVLGLDA